MDSSTQLNLRIGRFLDGAKPIGDGINGALRGFAVIDDEEVNVIAKYLGSDREILCEITCGVLGRNLDLPIPEPLLLIDNNNKLLFGSVDLTYPSFLHYTNDYHEIEGTLLKDLHSWVHLESASFFDELILNADRHNGNLLYNGETFFLIDHGLSIHEHLGYDCPTTEWVNKLASHLVKKCRLESEKSSVSNRATMWTDALIQNNIISKSSHNVGIDNKDKEKIFNFLLKRAPLVSSMINERLNIGQRDFINNA